MKTNFIHTEIPLFDGLSLHIDGNSKISWDNGTYDEPKPNAFSLPHIATCPGATVRCMKSCYVHGLKKHAPDVYHTYELNERALHAVIDSPLLYRHAADKLATWIRENVSSFRWHVSGDVFNKRYAGWIVDVCKQAPGVKFWLYTRCLWAVRDLMAAPNLAVNISADRENFVAASRTAKAFGVRICYLVSAPDEVIPELPEGSVLFPDYPLRGRSLPIATEAPWWKMITQEQKRMVCVADFYGQSESYRCGPCKKCLYP